MDIEYDDYIYMNNVDLSLINDYEKKDKIKGNKYDLLDTWNDIQRLVNEHYKLAFKDTINRFFTTYVRTDVSYKCIKYLEDMYNNSDKRFYDLFYEKLYPFGSFGEISTSYLKHNYIKYYAILCCYNANKDNFENYSLIVDDILKIKEPFEGDLFLDSKLVNRNLKLIEDIVSYKDYNKHLDLANVLSSLIVGVNVKGNYFTEKEYDFLSMFFKAVNYVGDKKNDNNISLILLDILKLKETYIIPNYNPLFYYGNRYEYMCNLEIEDNVNLKQEIFSEVRSLNYDLFNDLNENDGEDSFISCMNCVFDSDSYHELFSKLNLLKSASSWYELGHKVDALAMIKDLNSDSLKKVYNGMLFSYPKNSINIIIKPRRIIDRMKELYSKFDDSICLDFIDSLHSKAHNCEIIEKKIERRLNSPFHMFKQKLKKIGVME